VIDMQAAGAAAHPWWQDWRGRAVAIVGGGPSAGTVDLTKLQGRMPVVVINESFRLCPWADILYSCDMEWWAMRMKDAKKFAGIKLGINDTDNPYKAPGIHKLTIKKHLNRWVREFLMETPGTIGSGGNSGFQMINLLAQFGADRIALIGFDMHTKGGTHWHGLHESPLRNPDQVRFSIWRETMEAAVPQIAALGIDVVNCSMDSALTGFRKMPFDEMLEAWGSKP